MGKSGKSRDRYGREAAAGAKLDRSADRPLGAQSRSWLLSPVRQLSARCRGGAASRQRGGRRQAALESVYDGARTKQLVDRTKCGEWFGTL